ncbi:MAG: hypothetical protein ACREGE_03280 [Candidatus Microsaccharimonas sp.]
MNETPTPPTRTLTPVSRIVLVSVAYGFSLVPLVVWVLWPWLLGDTSGATYRTAFGFMIGLPIIALACSFFGLLLFRKSMKLALSPALILALIAVLFCYFIASSTVAP